LYVWTRTAAEGMGFARKMSFDASNNLQYVRTQALGFIQDILWRLNHKPDVLRLNSDCFLAQLLEEQVIFFLKIKQSCNPEKNKINRDEKELIA
jgi:hypothetical protein